MIIKPPRAAKLYLARRIALEGAGRGGQDIVCGGVKAVQDGFGQLPLYVLRIQQAQQFFGYGSIVDAVAAHISAIGRK